jgi:hypothetical protein
LKILLLSTLLVFSVAVLAQISVCPGIIPLLRLDPILNSKAKRVGQVVAARLVQNSPLVEGFTSKTGNTIVGRTIELNATADATGATSAYRFDDCRGHRPSRNQRPHVAVSGATKSGWAFAAEDGELTDYKENSLIFLCSRSVHSSRNAVAVQASPGRLHSPRDRDHRPQSWAAQWPSRNIYSAGFFAITLLSDAIFECAWRTIGEPTSLT